jgi:hypothetical protein
MHPYFGDTVIPGHATFEWLGDGAFLVWRASHDHPDIPDSVAVLGCDQSEPGGPASESFNGCSLHYYDVRGVFRIYRFDAEPGVWRFWRDWPGFSQRITATISPNGDTINSRGELSHDGATWEPDLSVTYHRA